MMPPLYQFFKRTVHRATHLQTAATLAGGSMAAELVESPIVWQVALRQTREQAQAERCLREGGFSLLEGNAIPPGALIGTVTVAFTITPAELEILNLLLVWNSAREIAAAVHASERA